MPNHNNKHLKALYTVRWRTILEKKQQQLDEDEHSDSGTEKLLFSSKTPMADAGSEKGSHLQWPVGGEGRKIAPRTHCGRESQPS